MKKILLLLMFTWFILNITNAQWTMEKAEHLAKKALYGATSEKVKQLYEAWSASGAVNILFPSREWPDRTAYNEKLKSLLSWEWLDAIYSWDMRQYYLYKKLYDPYEAKSKLFTLFEDTFSVDPIWGRINYGDIEKNHNLIYSYTLWNYKDMIKRNLYNNWKPWDYAVWEFLDLFNQKNPKYPNENYAREILQLMLMWEYIPTESEDSGWKRNYTEQDMRALAKILFWFRSDKNTHKIRFDSGSNTNNKVEFLSWSLKTWDNFPFASGNIIDIQKLKEPINWNNWLPDNIIDYIFSKRQYAISMFLADKFYRFYIAQNPTRQELDMIANKIIENNFDIYLTVKWLLASDFMYSKKSLNSVIYKNPLELVIWTIKKLKLENVATKIDLKYILSNLNFMPYYPWSIFWRDGYDDNKLFFTPYIADKRTTSSSRLASALIDYNFDYLYNLFLKESVKTKYTKYKDNVVYIESTSSITWNIVFSWINLISATDNWNIYYNSWTLSGNEIMLISWNYLYINNWKLDFDKNKFYISSWVLVTDQTKYNIYSWSAYFTVHNPNIKPDNIINVLEKKLYISRHLWNDLKQKLITFLTTDKNWEKVDIDFNNKNFVNVNLRWVLYMMLNQPEYILQSWYDSWTGSLNNNTWSKEEVFTNNNKIIFIKAIGWLDYLNAIIQKDEYNTYFNLRWSWGAMALTGLLDLNDKFYINKNLEPFKELYDSNNLRIINRVWTPDSSRGHDSASRKITSLHNKYWKDAGIFGYFIRNEAPWKVIVLDNWTKPYIFRDWNYMWIWQNAIYDIYVWKSWITGQDKDYMINTLKNIQEERLYSWSYASVFKQSRKIDSVARKSYENGWKAWIWYNMDNKFTFLNSLYDEWLANAVWLRADGGYDTHSNSKKILNNNFSKISTSIKHFFDKVKDKYNVTIVLYSEFWRTIKINSSNGFDHGHAGWMFIISNNKKLLNEELPNKIYWNMSIKDSEHDWLGVWIDYRAVYSALFKWLYNKDISSDLWWKFDINDYIDSIPSKISLFNKTFKYKNNKVLQTNLSFKVDDKNFHNKQGSYIKFFYGKDPKNMREMSWRRLERYYTLSDNEYNIGFDTDYKTKYYYKFILYDNQFNKKQLSWSFVTPEEQNDLSPSKGISSILKKYNWVKINGEYELSGDEIVLSDSWNVIYSWDNDIKLQVFTWTYVKKLTSTGDKIWDGWFVLPKEINYNYFIPSSTIYNNINLLDYKIWKLIKIWADSLWVGMELNKSVNLKIKNNNNNRKKYAILTSEDWKNWKFMWYTQNKGNSIIIKTDHFSYFLLVESDNDWKLKTNLSENTNTNQWNDTIENTNKNQYRSSWWWVILVKDNCPYGDFSKSYYDKTCGFDPYYEWSMKNITKSIDNTLAGLKWDLLNGSSEDDKYRDLLQNLINKDAFDKASIRVLSTLIKTKYIWIYKILYINSPKYEKYNRVFAKLANIILKKDYKTVWFKARFFNELNSFIVYLTIYKENPKFRKWLKPLLILKVKKLVSMYKNNVILNKKWSISQKKKITHWTNKVNMNKRSNDKNLIQKEKTNGVNKHISQKEIVKKQSWYDNPYLYEIATYSIKLKADPYWRNTNAYLYKGDMVEQLTKIHPKWFFKVKVIKSRDWYEWIVWYIFRKYLRKLKY